MDYNKHYSLLIERAKNREIVGYFEKHHVIPRCMGGDDSTNNIVKLTPEEHYLAHQLLMKIYPDHHGIIKSAIMMTTHNTSSRMNNKLFGWIRRKFIETMIGDNNPNRKNPEIQKKAALKRVGQKRTQATRDNISNALLGVPFSIGHLTNLRVAAANRKRPLDNKKIFMYHEDGSFISEYESIYECEKQTMLDREIIKGVADGKHQHLYKKRFFWEFKGEKIQELEVIYKSRGIPKTKEHVENQKKSLAIRYTCVHCGFTSSKSAINRYHNDYCGHNPNKLDKPKSKIKSYICVHCGKEGIGSVMNRWHNDNCKHKSKGK